MKKLTFHENIIFAFTFLAFINCSKSGIETRSANADLAEMVTEEAPPLPSSISEKLLPDAKTTGSSPEVKTTDTLSRKIIKNGNMRIQVGEIKKAQAQVNEIVKRTMLIFKRKNFRTQTLMKISTSPYVYRIKTLMQSSIHLLME